MVTLPIKPVTQVFNSSTLSFQNTQNSNNQKYGGFSSAQAQQKALKDAIAKSQQQNPEAWKKTTTKSQPQEPKAIQQASEIKTQLIKPIPRPHTQIKPMERMQPKELFFKQLSSKPVQGPVQPTRLDNEIMKGNISINNIVRQNTPVQYNPLGEIAKGATNTLQDYKNLVTGQVFNPNVKSKSLINKSIDSVLEGDFNKAGKIITSNPAQLVGELAIEAPLTVLPIGPAVKALKGISTATKTILKGRQLVAHPDFLTKYSAKEVRAVEELVDKAPDDPVAFKKLEKMVSGLDKNIQKDIDKQLAKTPIKRFDSIEKIKAKEYKPDKILTNTVDPKTGLADMKKIRKFILDETLGSDDAFNPGGYKVFRTKNDIKDLERIANDFTLPESTRANAIRALEKTKGKTYPPTNTDVFRIKGKIYPPVTEFSDADVMRGVGLATAGGLATFGVLSQQQKAEAFPVGPLIKTGGKLLSDLSPDQIATKLMNENFEREVAKFPSDLMLQSGLIRASNPSNILERKMVNKSINKHWQKRGKEVDIENLQKKADILGPVDRFGKSTKTKSGFSKPSLIRQMQNDFKKPIVGLGGLGATIGINKAYGEHYSQSGMKEHIFNGDDFEGPVMEGQFYDAPWGGPYRIREEHDNKPQQKGRYESPISKGIKSIRNQKPKTDFIQNAYGETQSERERKYLEPFGGDRRLALENEIMKSQQLHPEGWVDSYVSQIGETNQFNLLRDTLKQKSQESISIKDNGLGSPNPFDIYSKPLGKFYKKPLTKMSSQSMMTDKNGNKIIKTTRTENGKTITMSSYIPKLQKLIPSLETQWYGGTNEFPDSDVKYSPTKPYGGIVSKDAYGGFIDRKTQVKNLQKTIEKNKQQYPEKFKNTKYTGDETNWNKIDNERNEQWYNYVKSGPPYNDKFVYKPKGTPDSYINKQKPEFNIVDNINNFFKGGIQQAYGDTGRSPNKSDVKSPNMFDSIQNFFTMSPNVTLDLVNVNTTVTDKKQTPKPRDKEAILNERKMAYQERKKIKQQKPKTRDLWTEHNANPKNNPNPTKIPTTSKYSGRSDDPKLLQALEQQRKDRLLNEQYNVKGIPQAFDYTNNKNTTNRSKEAQTYLNYYDKNRIDGNLFANPYFGKPPGYGIQQGIEKSTGLVEIKLKDGKSTFVTPEAFKEMKAKGYGR